MHNTPAANFCAMQLPNNSLGSILHHVTVIHMPRTIAIQRNNPNIMIMMFFGKTQSQQPASKGTNLPLLSTYILRTNFAFPIDRNTKRERLH